MIFGHILIYPTPIYGTQEFSVLNTGLDRKDIRSQSHESAHAILKIHVRYVARIEHCMMYLTTDL